MILLHLAFSSTMRGELFSTCSTKHKRKDLCFSRSFLLLFAYRELMLKTNNLMTAKVGKLKNQSGFSAVEVVLVLVIVALVGVVGLMVYKNHNKTTLTN